ncbi:MAG: alpha/beta hydrolase [Gammaproteobacteria bacterium]|nr:alpha/beta hydrolase [Gammaproteobacteria bacterium]MBT8110727.1 alpha/beta hydrolase [Gammaproteobacteria bacterium]NNL45426.1 alpha/beta hydrolase [Woeseiaceae bacterium]
MVRFTAVLLTTLASAGAALAQPLELTDCRISAGPGSPSMKARCGTLLRPLDPAGAVAGEIELKIAVVPALNLTPEPDPFVPIAGGPGQGTVAFYSSYSAYFEAVRRNRDIVLVDQRGTGESSSMDCPIDDDLVEGQYSTELTLEYTEACLEQLPADPRFFTTSVAVTDLEAVREALGYPSFNLYGISYGTRVAQHFARRYPDSTRSIVLDGVVPPQISLGPEIATESQKAVDAILARCVVNPACNERFPGVQETFGKIVAQLEGAPVTIEVPHPDTGRPESIAFGRGELAIAVRLLAYHPSSIALLPLLINEAGNGNYAPLGSQFMMTATALSEALSLGMHNAIMCTEDIPFLNRNEIDYASIAASYMGVFQLDALETICSVWPAGPIDAGFKEPLATDLPVLLLSGDADPITPPRYAEMAAVDLRNARHLIGRHQGHGQIGVGCNRRLVATFVDAADPAAIDAECLERSFVMPFFLDFSGPSP